MTKWGVLWRSRNRLDGERSYLLWIDPERPAIFLNRKDARAYIDEKYGYIGKRRDLQVEPHGWKMPKAVRITVTLAVAASERTRRPSRGRSCRRERRQKGTTRG